MRSRSRNKKKQQMSSSRSDVDLDPASDDDEYQKTLKAKIPGYVPLTPDEIFDAFYRRPTDPLLNLFKSKKIEILDVETKPGDLSDELRTALGMPVGPNSEKVRPPWFIAMQRYGPPPSYH
ncbi:splicing factor 3B subunit 2-like [Octopus sinensis]|uniref:Splicing factor 3B subunit 2-like n=1 Tax=Octopus sinensis TaxID=2607531 RepID=A0A6P7S5W0_9MOLL|nr:splicing factor 3B subunit 2-like [Octopus sinensis]